LSDRIPKVFTLLDQLIRAALDKKPSSSIIPELPEGIISTVEEKISSLPIVYLQYTFVIKGQIDALIYHTDNSLTLIDFKFSTEPHLEIYAPQLMAYKYVLEQRGLKVNRTGILLFSPQILEEESNKKTKSDCFAIADFNIKGFISFHAMEDFPFTPYLDSVLSLLSSPDIPPPGLHCDTCNFVKRFLNYCK
jgi:hypothetical protein